MLVGKSQGDVEDEVKTEICEFRRRRGRVLQWRWDNLFRVQKILVSVVGRFFIENLFSSQCFQLYDSLLFIDGR